MLINLILRFNSQEGCAGSRIRAPGTRGVLTSRRGDRSLGPARRSFLEGSQGEANPPPQDLPLEPDNLSPAQLELPAGSPPASLSPGLPLIPSPKEPPSSPPSPAAVPSPSPAAAQSPTLPSPEPSPQPPSSPSQPQPVPPSNLPPTSESPALTPSPPPGASPSPPPTASPSPSSSPLLPGSPSPGSPSSPAVLPSDSPALPGSPSTPSPPPGQSPTPASPTQASPVSPSPLPPPGPVPLPVPSSPTTTTPSALAPPSPRPSPVAVASPPGVTPAASPRPPLPATPPTLLPAPGNPGAFVPVSPNLSSTPGAAPLPKPTPVPSPAASGITVPASPPAPPPCGYGVAPFCRLYVEDVLCDAQEGLISPRPWLELDIFCSQSMVEPIDPSCLVVEGPFNATVSYNLRYVASWVDSDPAFTGLATVYLNTSLPGCGLATYSCTADDGERHSHARAPQAVGVLIQSDADFANMETCAACSWQLDNLAWTDVHATSQPVTCQQLPFTQLPPSLLAGGWVDIEGTNSCPMAVMPAAAAGSAEKTVAESASWSALVGQEVTNSPAARRLLQGSPNPTGPLPQCSHGVEPFCRLFVEGALCDATQGLLVGKPSLEVDIFCSQFTLTGVPASCLSVQGPPGADSWFNLRYLLSWEDTQPDYLGWALVSLDTSAPGCDLAIEPCTLGAEDYYHARAPAPVVVMVTTPEDFGAAAACLENSWELDNLAWTDVSGSSEAVICQQQAFGELPPSFVSNGGWITYQASKLAC
ncbi:hypothetical protein N2152v2_010141 [Parachlorella kessleri]